MKPSEDAGPSLTQQFVCPAVERLNSGVLVLLVVLNRPEVSQGPHEAPEVDLVLSKNKNSVIWIRPIVDEKGGLIICGCTDDLHSH